MRIAGFFGVLAVVSGFGLLGCAVSAEDATSDVADQSVDEVSARRHVPVCKKTGSAAEGWYWSDTGKLIARDGCKGVDVTCAAVGTRSEAFVRVDNGAKITWGTCGSVLRVAADGKACGGSIGYGCEYSHACRGMPVGRIGGTGTCRDLDYCESVADCAQYMPRLAPPGYYDCEANHCVRHVAQAGLGGICGGFTNMQCEPGLVCTDANNQPAPTGTCKRPLQAEGELCGGIAGLQCAEGLFCSYTEGTCTMPDAAGACKAKFIGLRCAPPNPNVDNRICDCNGATQIDRCHAMASSVSIAHLGPCN